MSTRREFLRRAGLVLLGLLTGDAALDAFARLTHKRKYFALGALPNDGSNFLGYWILCGGNQMPLFRMPNGDLRTSTLPVSDIIDSIYWRADVSAVGYTTVRPQPLVVSVGDVAVFSTSSQRPPARTVHVRRLPDA